MLFIWEMPLCIDQESVLSPSRVTRWSDTNFPNLSILEMTLRAVTILVSAVAVAPWFTHFSGVDSDVH